jgi:uncharacterized membrane protein
LHIGEEINSSLVFPTLSTCAFSHLTNYVTLLQFLGLLSEVSWHALPVVTILQLFIFMLLGQKTVEVMKNNYPWTIFVQHLPLPLLAAELFHELV